MAPLSDLRVVELGRGVAAAYCGRQFAAWGGDVAVLEPADGLPIRRLAPHATGADGEQISLLWTYVAANKRVVAEEPLMAGGGLADLLTRADVFVTDFTDEALRPFGVTLRQLAVAHPHLCIVSITPFGLSGPYAGFAGSELVVQALSGYLASNGEMGEPPLRLPGHIGAYLAGVNGFVGALAAYYGVLRGGRGDLVEVSEMETLSAITPFLRIQYLGGDKVRGGGPETGVRLFPCLDGHVSFMPLTPAERGPICEILDIPEDAVPPDLFEGPLDEVVKRAHAFYSGYTRRKTRDEIFHGLEARGVACGRLQTPADLLADEHLASRGFFRTLDHPDLGAVAFPGPPAKLAAGDIVAPQPAPRPDEKIAAGGLGWSPRRFRPADAPPDAPLEGLRIVDFSQAWIGPFATMLLGDLGAEVIKIESHKRPDVWRQISFSPSAIADVQAAKVNCSPNFNSVNRNKRSLALDLTTEAGRDLCRRLIATADIVAENYTPRVMERSFGLGPATLSALKPNLIMLSSSGYGKTGPLSDYKANGSTIEAMAGWDRLHCYPGGPPIVMSFYQPDPICGMQMVALMLMALVRRHASGQGEFIDASMLEAACGYIGESLLDAALGGHPQGVGDRSLDFAPSGVFRCAGEDRWIAISIVDDAAWVRLASLPGFPSGLQRECFATGAGRLEAQDAIEGALDAWTADCDAEALMTQCQALGIAAGVVRKVAEGFADPHLSARGWFQDLRHPDLGTHKYNGFLWRCRGLNVRHSPPRLGEHSEDLLAEVLGLDSEQIAGLKSQGVTGSVL